MSTNPQRRPRNQSHELRVEREPVVLIGGYRHGELLTGEAPLEELEQLAEAANARVVGRVVQYIREINPTSYIGGGKIDEVKDLVKRTKARAVIFDHDLSPAQGRSLDKLLDIKVLDRTDLILDIFASRARTRMSMVAVGLAMAEYRLPRLRRLWTHLEGQKGGIGLRGGPGEKQIETDRRKVERRIFELKQEMKLMEGRKERTVRARKSEHCLVSLVGYTNAGKSTLMRALTGEDVEIQDKLFCTLDTKTSALNLGGGLRVMLSDTVGFIRRLPHHLVASFHATLEEARAGDLLLHVVDISSPWAREQLDAVKEVLTRVGCDHNEVQLVFNKIDRVTPEREFEAGLLVQEYPGAIKVSALQGTGLDELKSLIRSRVGAQASPIVVQVHAGDGKTLAFLATHFFEDRREYKGEWVRLAGRATKAVLDRLRRAGPTVQIMEGEFSTPPDPWTKAPLEPDLPEVTNP